MAKLEVLCSTNIKNSAIGTDLGSLRIHYTSTEASLYSTAGTNNNITEDSDSLFRTYIAQDNYDSVDENEVNLDSTSDDLNKTTVPDASSY
jgi:hypothetical protein